MTTAGIILSAISRRRPEFIVLKLWTESGTIPRELTPSGLVWRQAFWVIETRARKKIMTPATIPKNT
jgi:hypothetical protein